MNLNNLQRQFARRFGCGNPFAISPKSVTQFRRPLQWGHSQRTTDLCNNNDSPVSFVWIAAAAGACHYRWLFLFPCAVSTSFVPKHWSHTAHCECNVYTLRYYERAKNKYIRSAFMRSIYSQRRLRNLPVVHTIPSVANHPMDHCCFCAVTLPIA